MHKVGLFFLITEVYRPNNIFSCFGTHISAGTANMADIKITVVTKVGIILQI